MHETLTATPPIYVFINRINNRLVFEIRDGYKQELRTLEAIRLFGSKKKLIDKIKNWKNVPSLEVVEVVLM